MDGTTLSIDVTKVNRAVLNNCLKNGICEVVYMDNSGIEQTKSCTLKKFHMEDDKINDWVDHEYEKGIIVVWDMSGNDWRGGALIQIPVNRIIGFTQLTGIAK